MGDTDWKAEFQTEQIFHNSNKKLSDDLIKENEDLRSRLRKADRAIKRAREENERLKGENKDLCEIAAAYQAKAACLYNGSCDYRGADQWIPVSERVPEGYNKTEQDILFVWGTDNQVFQAGVYMEGDFWSHQTIYSGVTHWKKIEAPMIQSSSQEGL